MRNLAWLWGVERPWLSGPRKISRMDVYKSILPFCLLLLSGCSLTEQKQFWYQPGLPGPQARKTIDGLHDTDSGTRINELELAAHSDCLGSPDATLHYLRVLEDLWPRLESSTTGDKTNGQLLNAYNRSLGRFLICVQRHRQYVPGEGVVISTDTETRTIPIRLIGLPWTAADIQNLYPVGAYHAKSLTRQIKRFGCGMPLVAQRTCPTNQHSGEQFLLPGSTFSLTAVLKTEVAESEVAGTPGTQPILEFHNPLNSTELSVAGNLLPLAADLSAPFAFQEICSSQQVEPFDWFIHPEMGNDKDGLFFLEPYQPGKIPVVMIHGLMSSPRTWVDMANELRSISGFSDRYQIWGFRYATGEPFVASASILRRDLNLALSQLKETSSDPALDHIVLIGHSMGGLIAKAQISYSSDRMWCAVANRPLSRITTDHATRNSLGENFYFSPQTSVRRVVFVAVPHGGSTLATRLVGQLGSSLVKPDATAVKRHRQLIEDNPGVFSAEVTHGNPTSIDLLKSSSPLLQALRCLPVSSSVKMHSIVGNGRYSIGDGRGDGVVGIASARHSGVISECYVPASHTEVHRRSETVCEVWRILSEHHQQFLTESNPHQLRN